MDELVDIMRDVLNELEGINNKLESILGPSGFNSLSDIYDKIENIESYVSDVKQDVSEINDSLDNINSAIDNVKDEVSSVCDKLDNVDSSISSLETAVNSVESSIDSLERY